MENNSSRRLGIERWFTLILVIVMSIASLIPGAGFLASSLWPYSSDPTAISQGLIMFLFCLSCLVGSVFLLRTSCERYRHLLPAATIAGLVLGILLGIGFNHLWLQLIFGVFGPFMTQNSSLPDAYVAAKNVGQGWGSPNTLMLSDFWFVTLAVFLSLFLYTLVAFLVTLRTNNVHHGRCAALLAAFLSILVACFTYQVIFVPPLPDFSQATLLKTLEVFQDPPIILALFLGVAQAIHAGIGGFIGSVLARVLLH